MQTEIKRVVVENVEDQKTEGCTREREVLELGMVSEDTQGLGAFGGLDGGPGYRF